jgi:hypothetical protein
MSHRHSEFEFMINDFITVLEYFKICQGHEGNVLYFELISDHRRYVVS